jgi:excisionase family DNA binding protein
MFWKIEQVAEFLAVTPSMVYKLSKNGEIPCYRFGRCVRFDPDRVREWVKTCEVKPFEVPQIRPAKPTGPRSPDAIDALISKAKRAVYTRSSGNSGPGKGGK